MKPSLKPIEEQVIVITGASSGIGLATAEAAAQRGAKLVLCGRSEQSLREIASRMSLEGGEAIAVACDVSERQQVQQVGDEALERFGRIDTWVNNAGIGMYGRLDDSAEPDARRLFDINFWGVVNGSMVALPILKRNPNGGAIINVGSEVSDAAVPLLGMYTASKHAVKGFNDTLRVEVEEVDEAPISITLIQPTATDTPFPQHARNFMDREAKLPEPMIEPRKVAEAILSAAEKPTRATQVGGGAKMNVAMSRLLPGMADKMAAKYVDRQQYEEPPRNPEGILFVPSEATGLVAQTHGTGGREPG